MALSKEFYKTLEDASYTKDDIGLYREQINAQMSRQGENASPDLVELYNFLNEAESSALQMAAQGATFNFSDELTAPYFGTFPRDFYLAERS